jgi:hypothetical protein
MNLRTPTSVGKNHAHRSQDQGAEPPTLLSNPPLKGFKDPTFKSDTQSHSPIAGASVPEVLFSGFLFLRFDRLVPITAGGPAAQRIAPHVCR